jgi:hypothetical protein
MDAFSYLSVLPKQGSECTFFQSASALWSRPILSGPAGRASWASMAERKRSDPSACWRCRCRRIAWISSSKPGSECTLSGYSQMADCLQAAFGANL